MSIFDLILYEFSDFTNKEEFLIKIFPLLKKSFTYEENDFSLLLLKYFGKEFTYCKLESIMFELFEFYSHKINKLVMFHYNNDELKLQASNMNQDFF